MCGTDIAYGEQWQSPVVPGQYPICYAMCGTEIAYGMRCAVLRSRVEFLLPGRCVRVVLPLMTLGLPSYDAMMCGTEMPYGAVVRYAMCGTEIA
eukprot:3941699-Rhodomonas_salina.1